MPAMGMRAQWLLLILPLLACGDPPLDGDPGGNPQIRATANDSGQLSDAASDAAIDAADATSTVTAGTPDAGAPVVTLPDAPTVPTLPAEATATIGGARPAKVTVPKAWKDQPLWPLIVLLHGFGATGGQQDWYLGLSARATQHGFVAVVPEGTKDKVGLQFWNATKACCNFAQIPVDDVAYVGGLIDESIAKLRADPKRVYLVGHSNGGFMALRLACELSEKITAIASLAGAADIDPGNCNNARPVSVLQIHGTLDNVIQFNGGAILGNPYPAAAKTVADWVAHDGCTGAGQPLEPVNFEDLLIGKETQRTRWQPCKEGTEVEFWQVKGALHVPIFNDAFRDALLLHLLARTRTEK
jgi:polyhydroxybutyrate depolymerase